MISDFSTSSSILLHFAGFCFWPLRCSPRLAEIARLLIGSDEPDEVIHQADMECTGIALSLIRVPFPNLHPMMSHWDEY